MSDAGSTSHQQQKEWIDTDAREHWIKKTFVIKNKMLKIQKIVKQYLAHRHTVDQIETQIRKKQAMIAGNLIVAH